MTLEMITLFTQALQLPESSNEPEGIAATFMNQADDAEKFNDNNGIITDADREYEALNQKIKAMKEKLDKLTSKIASRGAFGAYSKEAGEESGPAKKSEL